MREIKNTGIIVLLRFLSKNVVKLNYPAGISVVVIEVKTERSINEISKLIWHLIGCDRCLNDFEHPRLIVQFQRSPFLCRIDKTAQFTDTPIRLNVAWRHDANHNPCLFEFTSDGLVEYVVTRKLRITPDLRFLTKQLTKTHLENTMKFGDPAFLAFCQWFVIQMGVANENIIHNGERD